MMNRRTGRRDDRLSAVRVRVDDEVLVGAVLEQAGLQRRRQAGAGGVALDEGTQQPLVLLVRVAIELVGVADLAPVVVPTRRSQAPKTGNPYRAAFRHDDG